MALNQERAYVVSNEVVLRNIHEQEDVVLGYCDATREEKKVVVLALCGAGAVVQINDLVVVVHVDVDVKRLNDRPVVAVVDDD